MSLCLRQPFQSARAAAGIAPHPPTEYMDEKLPYTPVYIGIWQLEPWSFVGVALYGKWIFHEYGHALPLMPE